jgi:hypothetical protein
MAEFADLRGRIDRMDPPGAAWRAAARPDPDGSIEMNQWAEGIDRMLAERDHRWAMWKSGSINWNTASAKLRLVVLSRPLFFNLTIFFH